MNFIMCEYSIISVGIYITTDENVFTIAKLDLNQVIIVIIQPL
jgi:hypothetical protein